MISGNKTTLEIFKHKERHPKMIKLSLFKTPKFYHVLSDGDLSPSSETNYDTERLVNLSIKHRYGDESGVSSNLSYEDIIQLRNTLNSFIEQIESESK